MADAHPNARDGSGRGRHGVHVRGEHDVHGVHDARCVLCVRGVHDAQFQLIVAGLPVSQSAQLEVLIEVAPAQSSSPMA